MKKAVTFILMISVLSFSSCDKIQNTENESSLSIVSNAASPAETSSESEESFIDTWNYTPPTSDNPMAICNVFPDPYFALDVAGALSKEVTAVVTYEELANYKGGINCGPSPLKSIEGIGFLKGITSFSSSKNDLEIIPAEFGGLIDITSINLLKAYSVKKLSDEIVNLKKLEFFRVDMTSLEELPAGIGGCEKLRILNVANTQIKSLPTEIGNLKNLEFLDLHSNDIDSVPDSICSLINLKILDIGYTKLKSVPKNIGSLTELIRLDLFGCQLKTLPASLKDLKKLRYLNVYDNFDLNEDYMKWFDPKVFTCVDDPSDDEDWAKWYFNE